jgi:hypothetical protein
MTGTLGSCACAATGLQRIMMLELQRFRRDKPNACRARRQALLRGARGLPQAHQAVYHRGEGICVLSNEMTAAPLSISESQPRSNPVHPLSLRDQSLEVKCRLLMYAGGETIGDRQLGGHTCG